MSGELYDTKRFQGAIDNAMVGFGKPWYLSNYWEGFEGNRAATRPKEIPKSIQISKEEMNGAESLSGMQAAMIWSLLLNAWPADANDLIHLDRELGDLNAVARKCGVEDIALLKIYHGGDHWAVSIDERLHPPAHEVWRPRPICSSKILDENLAIIDSPTDWVVGSPDILFTVGAALVDTCRAWSIALGRLTSIPVTSVDTQLSELSEMPLTKHTAAVLNFLNKQTVAMKRVDIATNVERDERTLRTTFNLLIQRGLVATPHGQRSGLAITNKGREWLKKIPL